MYVGADAGVRLDWNHGRRTSYGRYPGNALAFELAARLVWDATERRFHPGGRGAVGWSFGPFAWLVGVDYVEGLDGGLMPELRFAYTLQSN